MAGSLATHRFCTVTHYVQLSGDSVLVLHVHTLPESEAHGRKVDDSTHSSFRLPPPFSWLAERHMQELLVMVHEVVRERAVRGLESDPPSATTNKKTTASLAKPDLQLRRGVCVRALFSFKSNHATQHIVLPTNPALSPLLPSSVETFVNSQGKLVFDSTGLSPSGGGGYRAFRAVQDSLHVFVDQYEPTSNQGVVKVMMLLDPSHKQSPDILSYFTQSHKRRGPSGSEGEGDGEEGVLGELPVEGLKRRRRGGRGGRGGGGRGGRERPARGKGGGEKKLSSWRGRRTAASRGAQLQPTIVQSLTDIATSAGSTTPSPLTTPPLTKPAVRERKSSCSIDELFGMDSQWLSDDDRERDGGYWQSSDTVRSTVRETVLSPTTPTWSGDGSGEEIVLSDEETLSGAASEEEEEEALNGAVSVKKGAMSEKKGSNGVAREKEAKPMRLNKDMSAEESVVGGSTAEKKTEMEGLGTDTGGASLCVGVEEPSQRESSPELWSPQEEFSSFQTPSQPLEDITNSVGSAASPSQNTETHSPPDDLCRHTAGTGATADKEGEEGSLIVIVSDDEASTSQEKTTREKKKKKKKFVGPEILFRGAKEVRDIPRRSVSRWLAQQKQLLVDIFQCKVYSRRHESYVSGTRGRVVLRSQVSGQLFTEDQRDAITSGLLHAFCYKDMNLFSYVMSVLYPECLIRIIMDFYSISFEQAEMKMMGLLED